jgi:hypothetical protein
LYFSPRSAEGGGLLVYIRGWWGQYHGHVPAKLLTASARSVFKEAGLRKTADDRGLAVLVTGSSDVAVNETDVRAVERALGRPFAFVWVAAHSGGYDGLTASLADLRPAGRIVMLDDFYFPKAPLADMVRARALAGAKCTGFVTRHNLDRWNERFRPFVPCPVDVFENEDHTPAVARCLAAYLDKTTCL